VSDRASRLNEIVNEVADLLTLQRRAYLARPLQRDISLSQHYVLAALEVRGAMTISELADLVGVTAPSASAIIDRMEERDLVRRRRDALDRRVVHVEITERGQSVVIEMAGMKQDGLRRLLSVLTEGELEDVRRGLRAVETALQRLGESENSGVGDGTLSAGPVPRT